MSIARAYLLRLGGILAAAVLGGCAAVQLASELATREPPRLYQLTPPRDLADTLPETDATVVVEPPSATAGLNTARIALRPTPTSFDYFAGAAWADVLPLMVQDVLTRALENTGRIDAFRPDQMTLRADYALLTEIRDFQAEYEDRGGRPQIRVRLQVRLVTLPRRISVASTASEQLLRASGTSIEAIVATFDEALRASAREIAEWTVREVDRAERTRR